MSFLTKQVEFNNNLNDYNLTLEVFNDYNV